LEVSISFSCKSIVVLSPTSTYPGSFSSYSGLSREEFLLRLLLLRYFSGVTTPI